MTTPAEWLPLAFMILMGVAVLAYVVLDGFDLGVGMLLGHAPDADKDLMIASIGPFWDANETWLVLAVGILLVAFPHAHGVVLTALYLPVALMLVGLILRGVAFDFRGKVPPERKWIWNRLFVLGSWLAALSQGYMLGRFVMGLERSPAIEVFAALTAVSLAAGYRLIGATWLVHKTHGELQRNAIRWAREGLVFTALGLAAISTITPVVNPRVFDLWFSLPNLFLLAPVPVVAAALIAALASGLRRMPFRGDQFSWAPFAATVGIFVLAFHGLAFSFYPYVVPDKMTIWEAAAAPESLRLILIVALVQLPILIGCTVFVHRVFGGKATVLQYYDQEAPKPAA